MSRAGKFMLLFTVTATVSFADLFSITVTNPSFPSEVSGGNMIYGIQNVTLTNTSGSNWVVKVDTNYGYALPGSTEVVPGYNDTITLPGQTQDFLGDFLIEQNNMFFGVVFHAHDGLIAGDVYETDINNVYAAVGMGWTFWKPIYGITQAPPVALGPGPATQIGNGTSLTAGFQMNGGTRCDGYACAMYTVTDDFTITGPFFDPNEGYTIFMSSADCANGLLDGKVPEPASIVLLATVGLFVAYHLRRRSLT